MTCGIYQIKASNGHSYVGSSVNCEERVKKHRRDAMRRFHKNYKAKISQARKEYWAHRRLQAA